MEKLASSCGFTSTGIVVRRADGRIHDVGEWSYRADNLRDQMRWYAANWQRLAFWRVIFALEIAAHKLIVFSEWLKAKRA